MNEQAIPVVPGWWVAYKPHGPPGAVTHVGRFGTQAKALEYVAETKGRGEWVVEPLDDALNHGKVMRLAVVTLQGVRHRF